MTPGRLVLLSALLLGLLHQVVLPPWMGEDEPWQLEYVHHVARGHLPRQGALFGPEDLVDHPQNVLWGLHHLATLTPAEVYATQREIIASMRAHRFPARVDNEPRHADPRSFDEVQGQGAFTSYSQPFLYYVVCGALVRLSGAGGVDAELVVARLFALACYLLVVAVTLAVGRAVLRDEPAAALAGLVAAWLPIHARQSAVVSNDVLAKVWVALALLLALRFTLRRGGLGALALAAVCLGLGMATKTTAVSAAVAIGAAVLLRRGMGRGARLVSLGGLAAVLAAGVGYWVFSHNSALPKNAARLKEILGEAFDPHKLLKLWATSVGTTSWETRLLPDWVYWTVGVAGLAALALGLARVALPGDWIERRGLALCALLALAQFALLLLRPNAVGRYWLPALPAVAVLVAAGACGAVPRAWRGRAALAAGAALVVYEGGFLWGALVVDHYLEWGS